MLRRDLLDLSTCCLSHHGQSSLLLSHRDLLGHIQFSCSWPKEQQWQCWRWLNAVQGVCTPEHGWAPADTNCGGTAGLGGVKRSLSLAHPLLSAQIQSLHS